MAGTHSLVSAPDGSISGAAPVLRESPAEVSRRSQVAKGLDRERQLLRTLIDLLPDFIFVKDTQSRFLLVNQSLATAYGRRPPELLGRTDADFLPPPIAARRLAAEQQVLAGESVSAWEDTVGFPDGRTRTVVTNMAAFRDAQGAVRGLVGIGRDITKRKLAEEELRQSEERYHTLFDTLIEGFCTIEVIFDEAGKPVDYRFLEVNPAFEKQTGLRHAQGRLMRDLAPRHEAHWFETYGQIALTGQPAHFENEAKALGRYFDVHAYRVGAPAGRKVAILFNDITARKKAEQLMRRANRTLQAIRDCHEAMLRAGTERELLDEICRIIVLTRGERMAWVGFAEKNPRKTVRPVASAGVSSDYLKNIRVGWADVPRGRGPVGTAIRTGLPCLCRNTQTDPNFALWRAAARRHGYGSVLALPLLADQQCFGALSIYAPEPDAFDAGEQLMLMDLANDLAFGINALRLRAERERLEDEILKSTEREQERIGRDLHDGLCQLLVGAKFRSVYLQKISGAKTPAVEREAKALEAMLNHAIEQARNLARGLNPVHVTPAGLVAALQKLAADVESAHRVHCFARFPKPVKIPDHHAAYHLYRIAQEAVQNALKHARARNISITLTRPDHRIKLVVKDDGVGLPRTPGKAGMGLDNMQTRARIIGGRLDIRRRKLGGTTVSCELPANQKNDHDTLP